LVLMYLRVYDKQQQQQQQQQQPMYLSEEGGML
jgi:hypothetical protein